MQDEPTTHEEVMRAASDLRARRHKRGTKAEHFERMRICLSSDCARPFTPNRYGQAYHSKACGERHRKRQSGTRPGRRK